MRKMWKKIAAFFVAAAVGVGAWPAVLPVTAQADWGSDILSVAYESGADGYKRIYTYDDGSNTCDVYYVESLMGSDDLELTFDYTAAASDATGVTFTEKAGNPGKVIIVSQSGGVAMVDTVVCDSPNPQLTATLVGGNNAGDEYDIRLYPVASVDFVTSEYGTMTVTDDGIYNRSSLDWPLEIPADDTKVYSFDIAGIMGTTHTGDEMKIVATPESGYYRLDTGEIRVSIDGTPVAPLIAESDGSFLFQTAASEAYVLNADFVPNFISGNITDTNGGVEYATVILKQNGLYYAHTLTNGSGYYDFHVETGNDYSIEIYATDYEATTITGPIIVDGTGDMTVNEQLRDHDGYSHILPYTYSVNGNLAGATVRVVGPNGYDVTKTSDAEGDTVFADLPYGTYTVTATKAGYTTVKETVVLPPSEGYVDYTYLEMSVAGSTASGGSSVVSSHRSRSQTSYSGAGTAGIPQTTGNTTPQYTEQVKQAKAENKTAATIKTLGNSIDVGPDTLAELVSSGLDLLIQFGNNYAVLIPNSALQQLGSGDAVRFMMEKATPSQSNLDEGAKLNPKNRDLMNLTAVEVNAYRAGERVTSFGGQFVTIVANLAGFELTDAEKANMSGVALENMQKLPGKWTSAKDFAYNTNHFSKFAVMIADAPVKAVDLRMTLGSTAYTLNGARKTLPVAPDVVEDRVMVPLRFVEEAFGADVSWDDATKTATVTMDGKTVSVTVGQMSAGMDVAPVIVGDRVLVPLRFISQALGSDVAWDEDTRTIDIAK